MLADEYMLIGSARDRIARLEIAELEAEQLHHASTLYFPVITYPPPVGLPPTTEEEMFSDAVSFKREEMALYVHVPFCTTRCLFCHWVLTTGADEARVERYWNALDLEFRMLRERLGLDVIAPRSILIGGGTPTYPAPRQFDHFFRLLTRHVDLSACRQFTVEAEPTTLLGPQGDERLAIMREYGVQRVSLGVQSFDDTILKMLARVHDGAQAVHAIARLRESGCESISIDLIYGLPNQSLQTWATTMDTAVKSGADAWQLYQLRVLPHGDQPGKIVEHFQKHTDHYPALEDVLLMKMIGWEASERGGFPQQYTRIFARSPEHISYYLQDVNDGLVDVLGAGISSWSNIGRRFTQNIGNDFRRYHEVVESGHLPADRGMWRDEEDDLRRAFILRLKNTEVDVDRFKQRTGKMPEDTSLAPIIEKMSALGLIERTSSAWRLTDRGRFFADDVCMQFFSPQYVPQQRLAS